MYRHVKNKERYSLLSAISKDGNVRYVIHKDTIDGNKYTQFIEDNKDIFIGKTIIQDNVRFHHSRVLKEFCNSNNIGLHYIPAYTPDANPIEQFFRSVKSNFRKMNHDDIKADIRLSIEKVKETVNFNNYYKHSYEIIQSY